MQTREKPHQGHYGERCRQAVDAVDQVYGIAGEYEYQDRQWRSNPERYGVDAKQSVEVVDVQVGGGHDDSRQYLDSELDGRVEPDDVVDDACEIYNEQADAEIQRP